MGFFDVLEFIGDCAGEALEIAGACAEIAGTVVVETAKFGIATADAVKEFGDNMLHITDDDYVSPYTKKYDSIQIIEASQEKLELEKKKYEKRYNCTFSKVSRNFRLKKELLGKTEEKLNNSKTEDFCISEVRISDLVSDQLFKFSVGDALGIFGQSIRDKAASEFLENAKDFQVKVDALCAKLHKDEAILDSIDEQIDVEEKILNVLKENLEKNPSNKQQIGYLLRQLIETKILDSQGNISQKYINQLNQLQMTL